MILECGVDEVGRGSCISGVWVAACILDPERPIEGLKDSKKLSPRKREELAEKIKEKALCWSIGKTSLEEVEELNVHFATLLAMKRAVEGLHIRPDKVFVDGIHAPDINIPVETVVKGDDLIPSISAASILAKVERDSVMLQYHDRYPQYNFQKNKGYLTKEHMLALSEYGPCPAHRKTYEPIRKLLEKQNEAVSG
ncbi:ribonuclease HII [Ruminiclostridium hungatei]|uniref:Ribonuclease HII n=1 Tax=Ruminiclostridium hungatei TaxID=48256 RepID=A0A1V4SG90_RUMHU|nr:ribonuclease HII [Ruminiclostridium hungatei]OPX42495.1 ribonuclease HII [Ruminiclostridium hungatei]